MYIDQSTCTFSSVNSSSYYNAMIHLPMISQYIYYITHVDNCALVGRLLRHIVSVRLSVCLSVFSFHCFPQQFKIKC